MTEITFGQPNPNGSWRGARLAHPRPARGVGRRSTAGPLRPGTPASRPSTVTVDRAAVGRRHDAARSVAISAIDSPGRSVVGACDAPSITAVTSTGAVATTVTSTPEAGEALGSAPVTAGVTIAAGGGAPPRDTSPTADQRDEHDRGGDQQELLVVAHAARGEPALDPPELPGRLAAARPPRRAARRPTAHVSGLSPRYWA